MGYPEHVFFFNVFLDQSDRANGNPFDLPTHKPVRPWLQRTSWPRARGRRRDVGPDVGMSASSCGMRSSGCGELVLATRDLEWSSPRRPPSICKKLLLQAFNPPGWFRKGIIKHLSESMNKHEKRHKSQTALCQSSHLSPVCWMPGLRWLDFGTVKRS